MTLNGQNNLLQKKSFYGDHQNILKLSDISLEICYVFSIYPVYVRKYRTPLRLVNCDVEFLFSSSSKLLKFTQLTDGEYRNLVISQSLVW